MSQQNSTDFDIDPTTTSGTELAGILNRLNSAVLSMQSGTSRPAYAVQGFKWLDITDTVNLEKFFTGSTDLSILQYDTVNNVAEVNGGAGFTDKTKAIKHKVSAVATTVPVAGDVQAGEILVNNADKKLFFKDSSGIIREILEKSQVVGATTEVIAEGQDWSGIAYTDPDAVGANPVAKIYPDGTIVGSTDNGSYTKFPNRDILYYNLYDARGQTVAGWLTANIPLPVVSTVNVNVTANHFRPSGLASNLSAVNTQGSTTFIKFGGYTLNYTAIEDIQWIAKGKY